MNQKQYDAGQTIMQMSRIFAKAMRECMKNSGLLDSGYELNIKIWQPDDIGGGNTITESIRLDPKEINSAAEYEEKAFSNHCYEEKGWVVINDPIIKPGTVPPIVRTIETANRVFGSRKETAKATPPDGLWISRYNDPYPVDLGVSVNE